MEQALSRNPDIARLLVALFHARNDPHNANAKEADALRARIEAALNDVPSLDDDRIIRRFRNVVECTLRTNFYQPDEKGAPKRYVCDQAGFSQRLDELPAPRPLVEIFVYSPDVEGVHLRFGRVARGGIRWSDRREDFRTEVLGPGEGAAGEERGHRAGGRQGRLLSQAIAAKRRARSSAGGRHRRLQDCSSTRCST